jgi:hypothetical protein
MAFRLRTTKKIRRMARMSVQSTGIWSEHRQSTIRENLETVVNSLRDYRESQRYNVAFGDIFGKYRYGFNRI